MTATKIIDATERDEAGAGYKAPLLNVSSLRIGLKGPEGINLVDDISFTVHEGRTLSLVGESGCGKSISSLALMRLLSPRGSVEIQGGRAWLDGRDLVELPEARMRTLRGNRLAMIFQEPMTSLNPAFTLGDQLSEAIRNHQPMSRQDALSFAVELLDRVRVPAARQRLKSYPHELSGGLRQRVMIAMALSNSPRLLIADEPTTALDATIQADILDLMRELQDQTGTAMLLITHDLGVVSEIADDVAVMYAGQIVEVAPVRSLFADPQHPYTVGLIGALPQSLRFGDRLATIPGQVPPPADFAPGCRFCTRCPLADQRCHDVKPPFVEMTTGHRVACWHAPIEEAV